MPKNLVIVESPAKAKTIEKFLGEDYKVLSSYGHIRDLKKKGLGVDIQHRFKPDYEVPQEKEKLVADLKREVKKAETVWLASDEDREGEAIAWHLYEVLGLQPDRTRRIVFHEITRPAILKAVEEPRQIDLNLVNAQQARRVLDRIVGFELSPVLWRKVKPALSAGRVQSVTVRLIVEREREIERFKPEAAYRVSAVLTTDGGKETVRAELNKRFKTRESALEFVEHCVEARFVVDDVVTRPARRSPAPPFTTSTLQQEAARKLGYSVSSTMRIAQGLYEAGLITYMRTDSVNLSKLALAASKQVITETMGAEYSRPRQYTTHSKGAQEAHEAIRPTHMENAVIKGTTQEKRLYDLIYKRTLASQMADAQVEKTTVNIEVSGRKEQFVANGEVLKFDGFLKVYRPSADDETENGKPTEKAGDILPPLSKGQELKRKEITAAQRFSQHPPRYNEASLVHKLEELGIGRPSTYAPTISTIQQREYVVKEDRPGVSRPYYVIRLTGKQVKEEVKTEVVGAEKGKLFPTDVGIVVNDYLLEHFPHIMDYNFTADVEKEFDEVAEGEKQWTGVLSSFYEDFHPPVEEAMSTKSDHRAGERVLGTDPASGKQVSVKIGRYGPMVQIGLSTDDEKPRFATLGKGMNMSTVTLDEALSLFRLPLTLGEFEGKEVSVGAGRFGPYVKHDGKYVSLPKGEDPLTVDLDHAIGLILSKRDSEAQKHIKSFDEEPELEVKNGRFGPYMSYKGANYRIPKGTDPKALTLEACMQLINKQQESKGSEKPRRRVTKKK